MTKIAHFKRLQNMHARAPCNVDYCPGLTMTVGDGTAILTLPVNPSFFHAAKAVHGFIYFKMLDEACFFAANALVDDVFVLTTDFHMNLLRPVTTGVLRAEGRVVHAGRSQILAEAVLTDDAGKQVARGSGTFVRGVTPLSADIGYKD